jgi:hypothetical protein
VPVGACVYWRCELCVSQACSIRLCMCWVQSCQKLLYWAARCGCWCGSSSRLIKSEIKSMIGLQPPFCPCVVLWWPSCLACSLTRGRAKQE